MTINVIALRTSPNGSAEKTSRRVQIDYTESDDQINNDINDEDDDDYDDDDEDDDEVNVGDRLLPEKEQLLNCLAAIGYFGEGETQAQFAGMFTDLVHFLLHTQERCTVPNHQSDNKRIKWNTEYGDPP